MPKTRKTRNSIGESSMFSYYTTMGHGSEELNTISSIVSATIGLTTTTVLNTVSPDSSVDIPTISSSDQQLLQNLGVIPPVQNNNIEPIEQPIIFSNDFVQDIEVANVITETIIVEQIVEVQADCTEKENELKEIHEQEIIALHESYAISHYGLTREQVEELYNCFVLAYVNKGPYHLPSMNKFTNMLKNINDRLAIDDDDVRLLLYRDTLTALIQNRTTFFDNIRLNSELHSVRKWQRDAKLQIRYLTQQLADFHKAEGRNFFEGNMAIKMHKPKRAIYAQAILNINMAWYIYLHDTSKIDTQKYAATYAYVNQLGQDAYAKLIELLDEKYATIDEFLETVEDEIKLSSSDSSCTEGTSSSSSCADTSSSSSGTSCSESSSAHESSSCADSEVDSCGDYEPGEVDYINNNPVYVRDPITGGLMLRLAGDLCVDQNSKFYSKKSTRKTRKKKKKKKKKSCHDTRKCYESSSDSCGGVGDDDCIDNNNFWDSAIHYVRDPIDGGLMLRLDGGLCIDQNPTFNNTSTKSKSHRKTKKKKKKKKKKKSCHDTRKLDPICDVQPEICDKKHDTVYKDTDSATQSSEDDDIDWTKWGLPERNKNDYQANMYTILPDGSSCLVMNGSIGIETNRNAPFNQNNNSDCDSVSSSDNENNIHEHMPTYIYANGTQYLVMTGCVDVRQHPRYNRDFLYNYVKNKLINEESCV